MAYMHDCLGIKAPTLSRRVGSDVHDHLLPQAGMDFEIQEPGGAGNPSEPIQGLLLELRAGGFKSLSAAGRAIILRFMCEQITDTDIFRNFVGPLASMRFLEDKQITV